MAPNPRRIDARLQALYDRLPDIDCQGLCYDSCGPIDLSVREKERMERAVGHPLGTDGLTCNMLVEGRCSVYNERPMICRMWGVVEAMPCIYGCEAKPGLMPDPEAGMLLAESLQVGGGLTHADAELFRLLHEAQQEYGEGFADVLRMAFDNYVQRPTLDGRGVEHNGILVDRARLGVDRIPRGSGNE